MAFLLHSFLHTMVKRAAVDMAPAAPCLVPLKKERLAGNYMTDSANSDSTQVEINQQARESSQEPAYPAQ